MFRTRVSLGRLAALALITALAVPGGALSAAGATSHQQCEREGHSCGTATIAPCCCHAGPADQSAPATPASGRATLLAPNATPSLPAFLVVPPAADKVSLAALRLHSPLGPYYSGDLSIFFSTLLI